MADEINIQIEKDLQGEKIFTVERDGYFYLLNSRIDAVGASKLFSQRYGNDHFFNTLILFGFSDGRIVRDFLSNLSEGGGLIIFEPSKEIFEKAKKEFDLSDILGDKRLSIVYGENELASGFSILLKEIPVSLVKDLQYAILPNYDVIFHDICKKWQDMVFDGLSYNIINTNTLIFGHDKFINHTLENMPAIINSSDITNLIYEFNKHDFSDVPAIIVGAGPSLDKNVRLLKGMEDRVFIISTDAALKTLVKHGIKCHLIISVDSNIPPKLFDDEVMQRVGLVIVTNANLGIFSVHKENNFLSYSNFASVFQDIFGRTLDHRLIPCETGGSVSCDAYSLVKLLGFKKIVFIGQDLADTGGKGHTETFNEVFNTTEEEYNQDRHFVKVKDWDGNDVYADVQMDSYRKWFEKKFEVDENDGYEIYDATEGGAKKEHSIRITLKEILDSLPESEYDFSYLVNHTRKTFTRRQKSLAIKKLRRLPIRLRKLKREFYQRKEHFLKLSEEYELKKGDEEYLKNLSKDIKESMEFGKEEALKKWLSFENGDADNSLKNVAFDAERSFDELLKSYSDYYNRYYHSADSLIKRIEEKWADI